MLGAAREYVRLGLPVFPLWGVLPSIAGGGYICACGRHPCENAGKHPTRLTPHGFKDATHDPAQVAAWSRQYRSCNWGVALGARSKCFVFDFDTKDGLANFEREHGELPKTYRVKTSRGFHLYFRLPSSGAPTRKFDGGELRSDGAYVVSEGSIHPSGVRYECVCDAPIAEFPPALLEHFQARSVTEAQLGEPILEGRRNDVLFHIALGAARNGAMEAAVLALLRTENSRCVPPLGDSELELIAKSAIEFAARKKAEPAASPSQFRGQSASQVIEGHVLLDSIKSLIRRYVFLSEHQARIVATWVVHTHTFDAADSTPYLAITSAEKQSGKTRLLEVFLTLVANPWFTGRVTAAVLTRKIDVERPTLLLDESDAAFNGEKEYAEALRGVLNTCRPHIRPVNDGPVAPQFSLLSGREQKGTAASSKGDT